MSPHVLGLDLGLANAGAAQLHQDGQLRHQRYMPAADIPKNPTPAQLAERLRDVERWAIARASTTTALAMIEEMPHGIGAHGGRDERAAILWAVTGRLARAGIPVAHVNPTTLKHRIVGTGKASKDDMGRAVAALYPRQGLARASKDEWDAAGLATLGVCRLAAIHGPPWAGPWLNAQSLNLDSGFRWPVELHIQPAERKSVPLPMFEVPHR